MYFYVFQISFSSVKLNINELSAAISTVKARFSNSRLQWLKELASYLNNHTNAEADPIFSGKPRDYPSSILTPDLKTSITSTIKSCDDEACSAFFEQSLITLPSEMNRGKRKVLFNLLRSLTNKKIWNSYKS